MLQQAHDSMLSLQVQPQQQPCECSHQTNTAEVSPRRTLTFASWSDAGQAVQRQVGASAGCGWHTRMSLQQ
jgi:hypothetical protein